MALQLIGKVGIDIHEMHGQAEQVAALLKVMAHPERLMVLCQLIEG